MKSNYSVRSVIQWSKRPGHKKAFVYEERITAWNATSLDEAIALAEQEANAYADKHGFEALVFFQAYDMFDTVNELKNGVEIFSLVRESDLEESDYLDRFFDTGFEKQRNI